jgi:hypothetical protein
LAKPHRAAAAGAMRLLLSDVGRAILPAAFQAALSGHAPVFAPDERRLKAGGSQDWPPHIRQDSIFSTIAAYGKNPTAAAAHASKRYFQTFATG